MATKKSNTGKAMAKWDEELAKRAQMATKMEESSLGGGAAISIRGGIMQFQNAPIPGNKLNAVILDHTFLNAYYPEEFDPDNPQNPSCFAIGKAQADLAPHEKAEHPEHDRCVTCPLGGKEAWGTSDKGRGKACKNSRRLVLIPESGLEDIEAAQIATLQLPVTSVKGWAGYVKQLNDTLKRPTLGVITEISLIPDVKSQFRLQFKLVKNVPNESLEGLFKKADAAQEQLMRPYLPIENEDGGKAKAKPKAGAKARVNKKPAARGRR